MSESSAVEVNSVRKSYGALEALKGISLSIHCGELFGLLGPNGAGKSTLINIMAGLARASAGSVKIMGHDVVSDYRHARRSIGVVPQELVFDPFFAVRKFLRLQAGYFGLGASSFAWIDELIDLLDLSAKADSTLRQLSGGMRRRVLIAQALVHRPPVVVLDEPTAGVDVELRQALWRLINRLHDEGHTIILTTHYLEEAEALCDRIAILNHGELKALESKTALIAKHPNRFVTITLKDSMAVLPGAIKPLVLEQCNSQITFQLNNAQSSVSHLLQSLHDAQLEILDIETNAPGLEEVFLDILSS